MQIADEDEIILADYNTHYIKKVTLGVKEELWKVSPLKTRKPVRSPFITRKFD